MVAAPDGGLAAVIHRDRVVVVSGPELAEVGEIGLDPEAAAHDVVFAGQPPRLVVLACHRFDARMHVIELGSFGPVLHGELRFVSPVRVAAVCGDHVLVVGGAAVAIIDVTRRDLTPAPVPAREVVGVAGSLGPAHFVSCVGGVLEEWDVRTGAPRRRFRIGKPTAAARVGGGEQLLWRITQADLDHVEVVPLVAGRTARRISLPEQSERIAVGRTGEVLAMVGKKTGAVWVIDLAADAPTPVEVGRVQDVAWFGDGALIVVGEAGAQLVPLHGADAETASEDAPTPVEAVAPPPPSPSAVPVDHRSTAQRLAAWRERVLAGGAAAPSPLLESRPPLPSLPERLRPAPGWRESVAMWARRALAGSHGSPPELGAIQDVAVRLQLDEEQARAIALVYGAHLCGVDGVAGIDLAQVLGWRWDEALGTGALAIAGALRWRRSRVHLSAELAATLDQQHPRTGELVGEGELTTGAIAVVAPADVALAKVAAWAAPRVGALLVPAPRPHGSREALLREARMRGVTPLVPLAWLEGDAPSRVLVVVPDEASAAARDLELLGVWGAK